MSVPSYGGIIVASVYHTSPSIPEEILLSYYWCLIFAYYAYFSQFVATVYCTLGHEPELISVAIYADKLLGVSKWVYVAIVILRGQNKAQIFLALETCVEDHISVLPVVMHIH